MPKKMLGHDQLVELKPFFLKRTWCYFGTSFWVIGGQYVMTWLHLGSELS